MLVFEYDRRPETVDSARRSIQTLLARGAPVLGSGAAEIAFSAGGPEDVGQLAAGAKGLCLRR
jgi:hypothetical protein